MVEIAWRRCKEEELANKLNREFFDFDMRVTNSVSMVIMAFSSHLISIAR